MSPLMASFFPPPSSWWFLPAVLAVTILFLGFAWIVARSASRRADSAWHRYRPGVERCGLQLLPFNEGAGDDEDDTERPEVRAARHRVLAFGKGLRLFSAASDAVSASVQPIAEGGSGDLRAYVFSIRFSSDETRFNAWVCDKTVVGLAGPWLLPRCVILPRGAGASISRAFDAVDYETDDLTESPISSNDELSRHYRLLGSEAGGATDLPPVLLHWLERNPATTVEADQGRLIVSRGNRPLEADALAALLRDAWSLGQELVAACNKPFTSASSHLEGDDKRAR